MSFEDFVDGFFETALWSSTDWDEVPLDDTYSVEDFDEKSKDSLEKSCKDFWDLVPEEMRLRWDDSRAGHDFWLTRCGHGAGFWDGDYNYASGHDDGDELTKISKTFGSVDLYVGDDKKVCCS